MFPPLRLLVASLALFAAVCLRASFAPVISLVPGTGIGMVSEYASLAPKWGERNATVLVPASATNEANLVWTFWGHTRPASATWPKGEAVRLSLTIAAEETITLRPAVSLRAGEWTTPQEAPVITLSAGKPLTVLLPLPRLPYDRPVESIRILLVSDRQVPALVVSAWAVGEQRTIALHPPDESLLRGDAPVIAISGETLPRTAVSIQVISGEGAPVADFRPTSDADGRFEVQLDRAKLPVGPLTLRAAVNKSDGGTVAAREVPVYHFPLVTSGNSLPMVQRTGRELLVNGKPWGFVGLNYTRFNLGYTVRAGFREAAEDLRTYAAWGINVLRIPLNLSALQPAQGMFPDSPRYAEIMRAHRLDPEFFNLLDSFIGWAGHHGIRIVLEWHEVPNDPYRYFIGGNEQARGSGQPGGGIAWLSDVDGKNRADWGDPRLVQAVADTNRWLARRYKGNGNLLGIEVPYNEPHSEVDSSELAWRRITADTLRPIVSEDPARLTFGMAPAWGHGNVFPSATWLLPDDLSGVAPHYYLGNGPVALRPDAKTHPEPWLARDVAATFDHSFAAVALPHSAVPAPVWNGESGEHGFESLFPDLKQAESAPWMIEAQLVQAYAAGMCGSLGWTLTGHDTIYQPLVPVLEKHYRRFAPVYAAGPVDHSKAKILFVQNPGAVPVANGLNYACVPFARLALDLHLAPVHYMTDDQLLANGLVQISAGLEQVETVAAGLNYRAAVVDTRNLDSRALDLLRAAKLPILTTDDAAKLTADELADFLASAGQPVDRRTPPELQLIPGRAHLIVYRRSGENTKPIRVYPRLDYEGARSLVDEQGRVVFTGAADRLAADGIPVDVAKWTSSIFRLVP